MMRKNRAGQISVDSTLFTCAHIINLHYPGFWFQYKKLFTKKPTNIDLQVFRRYLIIKYLQSGELGIRTPGGVTLNGFQDRRNRPLCQLSAAKVHFDKLLPKICLLQI